MDGITRFLTSIYPTLRALTRRFGWFEGLLLWTLALLVVSFVTSVILALIFRPETRDGALGVGFGGFIIAVLFLYPVLWTAEFKQPPRPEQTEEQKQAARRRAAAIHRFFLNLNLSYRGLDRTPRLITTGFIYLTVVLLIFTALWLVHIYFQYFGVFDRPHNTGNAIVGSFVLGVIGTFALLYSLPTEEKLFVEPPQITPFAPGANIPEDAYFPPPPTPEQVRTELSRRLSMAFIADDLPIPSSLLADTMLSAAQSVLAKESLPTEAYDAALDALTKSLTQYVRRLPRVTDAPMRVPLHNTCAAGFLIKEMMEPLIPMFANARGNYYANIGRITQDLKAAESVYPDRFKGTNEEIVDEYMRGSPLQPLLNILVPYPIEQKQRFAHSWVLGASDHGKSTTLTALIAADLPEVIEGKKSVVVIEPKDDMIPHLLELKLFAKGQPLHDRLIYLDPKEFTPAINLLKLTEPKYFAQQVELYRFMFASLLNSEMRDRQETLFENSMLLLQHVPDSCFADLLRVLGREDYSAYYNKLGSIERDFFTVDFKQKGQDGYEGTRKQLRGRIMRLAKEPSVRDLFFQRETKVNLDTALNEGSVILVNAKSSGLGVEGARFFGRFILALLASAADRRSTKDENTPVHVYLDEADLYCKDDPMIVNLLARVRAKKFGMLLAHQNIDGIGKSVAKALETNTAVIMAGGLKRNGDDYSYMRRILDCPGEWLEEGKPGHYGLYVRGKNTVYAYNAAYPLNDFDLMTPAELADVKAAQRAKYGGTHDAPPDFQMSEDDATTEE